MGVCKSELEIFRSDIEKCFRCNLCKMVPLPLIKDTRFVDACPISRHYHFHGYSGSGMQFLAHSLIDGRLTASEEMAEIAFSCRTCGYCDVACKSTMDAERTQVIQMLREHLVSEGFAPASHQQALEHLQQEFDSLRQASPHSVTPCPATPRPASPLVQWAEQNGIKVLPRWQAAVVLYGGNELRGDTHYFEIVKKIARLMQHAGVDFGVLDAEPDSGIDYYWMAYRDGFVAAAENAVSRLRSSGAQTLVTASGTSYGMFTAKYHDYGVDLAGINVLHATQFLQQLINTRKLRLTRPINARVTYHDPCFLGRQSERTERWQGVKKVELGQLEYSEPTKPIRYGRGVYAAPRELLQAIPGLEFVEMYRTREHALCCGYGGGGATEYADLIHATGQERLREASSLDVDLLVTACGYCERQFRRAQSQPGDNDNAASALRVVDIVELIYKAAAVSAADV